MEAARKSRYLVRWAGVLATAGFLIFAAASIFLLLALWHVAHLSGYGPTYVVFSSSAAAAFALAVLAVLVAAAFVWRTSSRGGVAQASRRCLGAIVATLAALAIVAVAFLVLAQLSRGLIIHSSRIHPPASFKGLAAVAASALSLPAAGRLNSSVGRHSDNLPISSQVLFVALFGHAEKRQMMALTRGDTK